MNKKKKKECESMKILQLNKINEYGRGEEWLKTVVQTKVKCYSSCLQIEYKNYQENGGGIKWNGEN